MKKILFITTLFTSALVLSSCNHEPDFPGLDEATRPTAVKKITVDFAGTYPSKQTGGNYFTESVPASDVIPSWLSSKYYSLDSASIATVAYDYMEMTQEVSLMQNFTDAVPDKGPTEVDQWYNITTKGTKTWVNRTYSGNVYTQFSAYGETGESVGWLISPRVLVSNGMKLSFDACIGNFDATCLQILVSTNFNGINVATATWVDKSSAFTIPAPATGYGTLGPVGTLDLSSYAGKNISVAFKYSGDGVNHKTTTYQIDNVKIYKDVKSVTKKTDNFKFDGKQWNWVDPAPVYESINQTFERPVTVNSETTIDDWMNATLQGTLTWIDKTFSGNTYTQFTANKAPGICEGWFIAPKVKVVPNMKLSFDVNVGYYNADCLQVLISTDFKSNKDKISSATWEDVTSNFTIPQTPTTTYGVIAPAGEMSLAKYEGKIINVAFKYLGTGPNVKTTTYQIDNVFVGVK